MKQCHQQQIIKESIFGDGHILAGKVTTSLSFPSGGCNTMMSKEWRWDS